MSITERIDNITTIDPNSVGAHMPAPKSVKIELTANCNFRCSFCATEQRLRTRGSMDFGLFTRLASEMRAAGVDELGLFYLGESFLSTDLIKAIFYAKTVAKYPYVFLTTNGSIAFKRRTRECFLNGLDSLKFSLNYADAEQLNAIARVNGSNFKNIIQNIRDAYEAREEVFYETGHFCGLYASYIRYNDGQDEKMSAVLDTVRPYVDEIYALPLYNQAAHVNQSKALAGNVGRADNMRPPVPCWSVFTEGHVTWDGKLSACCFDHDGRFEMGDLTRQPFMEAWNSVRFQELRSAHISKDLKGSVCEKCIAWSS